MLFHGSKTRVLALFVALLTCAAASAALTVEEAREFVLNDGFTGGLIAHVGCGDGRVTAGLGGVRGFLVHGVDTDLADVAGARQHVRRLGLAGSVAFARFDGKRLPYADGLVNLMLVEDASLDESELLRVLAPGGIAHVQSGQGWKRVEKAWPSNIDEWTHYLHGADNNAVAQDGRVAPPKHLQWVAGPMYCRSHEIDSSVCAMVSARGRIFYILDEGLTGITDWRLPGTWALVARDGFNGVRLWKRPLPDWGWRQWKEEAYAGKDLTGVRGQRTAMPVALARRLVAKDGRVFVTLGFHAPVSVADAATGEVLRELDGTAHTDEILCSNGHLVLRIADWEADAARRRGEDVTETIALVDPESGRLLWQVEEPLILPMSLAAASGRVVYRTPDEMVCLDQESGEERWRIPAKGGAFKPWRTDYTLIVASGLVFWFDSKRLEARSLETGELLWEGPGGEGPGVANPPDLFFADGLVWAGGEPVGRDPRTGEVQREIDLGMLISPGHHYRCYRSKATDNYLLWPKRGVEFIDLDAEDHMRHDWLRAPCRLGVTPCNGLLYMPPHQCFCYAGAKIDGFNALSAGRQLGQTGDTTPRRLTKGSAYNETAFDNAAPGSGEWPVFRRDAMRSGSTPVAGPANLTCLWKTALGKGAELTQPVMADGRLYVASVDTHTVHCLDAGTGSPLWAFTAGGRVDSPPAIHGNRVLFGSRDGHVYCLRTRDGALLWQFRAAPDQCLVGAFNQLESAWPVHGSVLLHRGLAYFAAGRSSFLDGGIRLYALDPATGAVVHETCIEGPYPDPASDEGRPFDMEGTRNDVLVTDGEYLYMQQTMLNDRLEEQETERLTDMGDRKMGRHLLATGGLLNDEAWNRTFWMYSERWPGFYIANQAPKAGQLLVFDDTTTYGVKYFTRRNRHSPMFFPETDGYLVFADDNENEPLLYDGEGTPEPVQWLPEVNPDIGHELKMEAVNYDKGTGFTRKEPPKWQVWLPVRVRAMALASDTLYLAGPPDVLDPDDPLGAFKGRKGGRLWAVSAADGAKKEELALESPPVFDGMIAARERLFVALRDGTVVCVGPDGTQIARASE